MLGAEDDSPSDDQRRRKSGFSLYCSAVLCCGVVWGGDAVAEDPVVLWCSSAVGMVWCGVVCSSAVVCCGVLCCGVLCCAVLWCGDAVAEDPVV